MKIHQFQISCFAHSNMATTYCNFWFFLPSNAVHWLVILFQDIDLIGLPNIVLNKETKMTPVKFQIWRLFWRPEKLASCSIILTPGFQTTPGMEEDVSTSLTCPPHCRLVLDTENVKPGVIRLSDTWKPPGWRLLFSYGCKSSTGAFYLK